MMGQNIFEKIKRQTPKMTFVFVLNHTFSVIQIEDKVLGSQVSKGFSLCKVV